MNNAGVGGRNDFLGAEPELIEHVTRINYLGSVWTLKAFLPALERGAPSHLVNVVSVAGTVADRARLKKPLLALSTALGAAATCLLFFVGGALAVREVRGAKVAGAARIDHRGALIARLENGAVAIDGVRFHSSRLTKVLAEAGADRAFVAAVSAGPELEAEAQVRRRNRLAERDEIIERRSGE